MDPVTGALIAQAMKLSVSAYLAYQKANGKTEEEAKAMLLVEVDKALAFDPSSIRDV